MNKPRIALWALVMIPFICIFSLSPISKILNPNGPPPAQAEYHCGLPYHETFEPALLTISTKDMSEGFELVHQLGNVHLSGNIALVGEQLIFAGSLGEFSTQLVNYDLSTKQTEWNTCIYRPLVTNSNYVYAGYSDFGAFIAAFDIDTGERIWHTKLDNRTLYEIQLTNYGLLVTTNSHGNMGYYLVNPITGAVQKNFQDFYELENYLIEREKKLRGKKAVNFLAWEYFSWIDSSHEPSDSEYEFIPDKNLSLIVSQKGKLTVVNTTTGETIWETDNNLKSNIAVSNDLLYFLTTDSRLEAHDLSSGELLGQITFSPSLQTLPEFDFHNADPKVVVEDENVLVYFETGQQLFVFQFYPPGTG